MMKSFIFFGLFGLSFLFQVECNSCERNLGELRSRGDSFISALIKLNEESEPIATNFEDCIKKGEECELAYKGKGGRDKIAFAILTRTGTLKRIVTELKEVILDKKPIGTRLVRFKQVGEGVYGGFLGNLVKKAIEVDTQSLAAKESPAVG